MKPEPDSKPEPEHTTTQEDARGLRLSCVRLTQTQSWCYHEGSYGYNPEYGSTHILTLASSANATHTKTDHNDGSNFNKTAAAGVTTFWKIRTSGESQVDSPRYPTGSIGHTHSVKLKGDRLTVTVNYQETGETKTEELSVAELYRQFVEGGSEHSMQYKV